MNKSKVTVFLFPLVLVGIISSLAVLYDADTSMRQPPSKPDIVESDIVMCRILDEARGTVLEEPMIVTSAAMRKACERGTAVFIVPDIEIEKLPAAAPQPWVIHEQEARD